MNTTWAMFRRNPNYLVKYFISHTLILLGISLLLWKVRNGKFDFNFSREHLLLLPLAFLWGIQIPVLMHNCMHANMRTKLGNFICGEFAAFFALMSLGILRINHMLHHAYSDTDRDPHDPSNKSFLRFFFTSQFSGVNIIQQKYFEFHGQGLKQHLNFKTCIFLHYAGHILRLVVWALILGPEIFCALYIPAFIIYSLAFAHINYVTHRTDSNGKVEILNKDDNFYYKFVNFIGSGVYYHKNHHLNPRLLNPMLLSTRRRV